MSIIIRDNNNRIMLLCKGADDVILQRVAITNEEKVFNKQQLEDMHNTLNTYACEGLRTLVFAQKYIL